MREWKAHSYEKISIFRDYVEAFVRASSNAFNRVYIDAFAGDTENVLRVTGERFPGSAEIALAVEPPFTHVALFELPHKAKPLRNLQAKYGSGREVRVYEGNCNELMIAALRGLPIKAPTFAFIDPDGMEVEWRTIRLLADHKRQYSESQNKTKVEMWILFSTGGMARMLGSNEASARAANLPEKVARLYGGWGPWERVWKARLTGELDPGEARLAYLLLYMDRLEELGYRYLLARPVHTTRGELYVMVFASDSTAGGNIMQWAQQKERVVKRADVLFEMPEARPQYDDIHTGWRDQLPFELPEWREYDYESAP
jgi:three-Cys-motif partner protein